MGIFTSGIGIKIVSSPSDAEIFIDGGATDKITPHTFNDLSPGNHTFELKRLTSDGLTTFEKTVKIEKGKVKEFLWLLGEPSGVKIVSSPSDAEIFIDGDAIDKITPETLSYPSLSLGTHKVELRYESLQKGLMTYEEDIKIEKDKFKEFRWVLEET